MDKITGKEFERLELLIGKEKQDLLKNSTVAIFGLGGVGTFAAESLARSGIGTFILVDFDKINITNFNRLIIGTKENIGFNKAEIMEKRIKSINHEAIVYSYTDFLDISSIEQILGERNKINFCIEAIDSLGPKIKVINILLNMKIPFISSMGAGGRLDPFKIKYGNLSDAKNCNLAKRIIKGLKKYKINLETINVIYSEEKGSKPEIRETWDDGDYCRGRLRGKIGSSCFVPASFGIFIAYLAFKHITDD